MARFNIEIRGIAIIYFKEKWKVIFPFAGCHRVKFSAPGVNPTSLAGRNQTITFEVVSGARTPAPAFGTFLNLSADYAHRLGDLVPWADWNRRGVLLELTDAAPAAHIKNRSRYELEGGHTAHTPDINEMDYWAKFQITADRITMKGSKLGDVTFDQDNTTLLFNNDCEQYEPDPDGDVQLVYNIFSSKSGRRLTTKRPGHETLDFETDAKENGNPAPEEGGLPCHNVITQPPPDGLP